MDIKKNTGSIFFDFNGFSVIVTQKKIGLYGKGKKKKE